jgi:hypothetical protein
MCASKCAYMQLVWIGIVLTPIRIRIRLTISMLIQIQIMKLPQVLQMLYNHNFFPLY